MDKCATLGVRGRRSTVGTKSQTTVFPVPVDRVTTFLFSDEGTYQIRLHSSLDMVANRETAIFSYYKYVCTDTFLFVIRIHSRGMRCSEEEAVPTRSAAIVRSHRSNTQHGTKHIHASNRRRKKNRSCTCTSRSPWSQTATLE